MCVFVSFATFSHFHLSVVRSESYSIPNTYSWRHRSPPQPPRLLLFHAAGAGAAVSFPAGAADAGADADADAGARAGVFSYFPFLEMVPSSSSPFGLSGA